ncbi:popeye domain-containing 2 [Schistocerca americana]|nr:popeye domain-containing 2 [Schistocerca americana]
MNPIQKIVHKYEPVSRILAERMAVYLALFQPLRVTRHQFKKVLNCMRNIRKLKYQEVYAQEKVTKVDSLSLVLTGKLVVSQNGRALHIVFPHQFLDSPEWFGVSTDEFFQVSITAMEESQVLVWHRDKLKLTIITDQFLQAVFDHILGRDVVKKLMQVSETMAASNNGHLPNSLDDGEDKPMLIVKKTGEGPGITALINRQLQGMPRIRYYYCATDPNAWRLGRIEEADHETPV